MNAKTILEANELVEIICNLTALQRQLLTNLADRGPGLMLEVAVRVLKFPEDVSAPLRDLQRKGLILLNFVAAAGIFLLTATIIPEANNWLTAIFIGFAWPTVIRNASFKLAQPIQSESGQEEAAIRFEQAYATFQGLARS